MCGDESAVRDHFDAHLATGDTQTAYCRTGCIGFVRRTEMMLSDGGLYYLRQRRIHSTCRV